MDFGSECCCCTREPLYRLVLSTSHVSNLRAPRSVLVRNQEWSFLDGLRAKSGQSTGPFTLSYALAITSTSGNSPQLTKPHVSRLSTLGKKSATRSNGWKPTVRSSLMPSRSRIRPSMAVTKTLAIADAIGVDSTHRRGSRTSGGTDHSAFWFPPPSICR